MPSVGSAPCPAPRPGTATVTAACKSLGRGHRWGRAGWVEEKAIVCHTNPKGTCVGGHKLPDVLGITFHRFTISCMFEVSRSFGSLEGFPDVLMNSQGWECSRQAERPPVTAVS